MTSGSVMSDNPEAAHARVDVDSTAIVAKWKPLILALMIAALLLRILAAMIVERHVQAAGRSFLIEGDANGYWQLAQNIAAGKDYAIYDPPRYVLRVPGFPLLLAASMKLFGDSVFAARIVLAVVGTGCCWLTYCLGCRVHMRRTGFWAALFVAVNPLAIVNSVLILSEGWFTFWMLLSLLALLRVLDQGAANCEPSGSHATPCAWRLCLRSLLAGALIGATVLIRPGFLPWLAVCCVAVLLLLKQRGLNQPGTTGEVGKNVRNTTRAPLLVRLLVCGGLVTGCVTVILPWAARNAAVTGHWVFTSLWSGPSLYDGLNANATGASDMQFFEDDRVLSRMSEYDMNEYYKSRALHFAMQNPGRVAVLAVRKAALFLSPVPKFAKSAVWGASAGCAVFWLLLVVTSVVGLRSREWDGAGLLVMVGPLLLFLLVHMVFVGSVRYRLPLEFPLSVLAAIGWRRLVLRRNGR